MCIGEDPWGLHTAQVNTWVRTTFDRLVMEKYTYYICAISLDTIVTDTLSLDNLSENGELLYTREGIIQYGVINVYSRRHHV